MPVDVGKNVLLLQNGFIACSEDEAIRKHLTWSLISDWDALSPFQSIFQQSSELRGQSCYKYLWSVDFLSRGNSWQTEATCPWNWAPNITREHSCHCSDLGCGQMAGSDWQTLWSCTDCFNYVKPSSAQILSHCPLSSIHLLYSFPEVGKNVSIFHRFCVFQK